MALVREMAVQDHIALAEIEMCGELIIAASAAHEERLSPDRIDEVLRVAEERPRGGPADVTGWARQATADDVCGGAPRCSR
ncbi:hypothetical protein GCM10018793_65320 [Streptomyces sulfonofaciens]|uniref:Uncharacterized protein n=1 Tax=Streptomyces sulfonofaciens TaxID=68272 RepID=A0A919LA39_9ACTN|nr:hypothetical protein [Streptomyces sulfonofaciens]GHH87866.1 hypothetical protein GCM10018793_65320 [Streptomyces sulfonofaciens]